MNNILLSVLDFFSTMMHVAMVVPKNKSGGNWMTASMKILSIRYLRIFFSAPPRYSTPGNSTIASVPMTASQLSMGIVKAQSALLFRASARAGEYRGSVINSVLGSLSHLMEEGRLVY